MGRIKTAVAARIVRHMRLRQRVSGTPDRPRLNVFRSARHTYAQVIDDTAGHTLAAAGTLEHATRGPVAETAAATRGPQATSSGAGRTFSRSTALPEAADAKSRLSTMGTPPASKIPSDRLKRASDPSIKVFPTTGI